MPTVLQSASFVADVTSGIATVNFTGVRQNSLLVMGVWHYNSFIVAVSDTFGLTWKTPYTGIGGGTESPTANGYEGSLANDYLDMCWAFVGGSHSGNVTISITSGGFLSGTSIRGIVAEISGIDSTAVVLDAKIGATGNTQGTINGGNLTTSQPNDFIFAVGFSGTYQAGGAISAGTAYTPINSLAINYGILSPAGTMLAEGRTAGATGTYSSEFIVGGDSVWIVVAAAFKALAAVSQTTCIPVGDLVINICKKAGIDPTLVDVSLLTSANLKPTNLCCGYLITRPTPAAQLLQTLMQAFFFDIMESGGKLRCVPRGMASAGTIPESDLGLEKDQAKLTEIIGMEQDLPREVTVLYNDENLDYLQGKQLKLRNSRIVATRNQELVTLPMTMDATTARQIAEKILYLRWLERNSYLTNLWMAKYLTFDPTDVLQFVYEGITFQMRVVDTTIGQGFAMAISGVGDNARNYLSSAQGGTSSGPTPPPVDVGALTMFWLFDIPLLRDSDTNPGGTGYYYAMSSAVVTWPGGILFKSADDTSFAVEDTDNKPASFGYANNILPAPRSPWTWDTVNKLNITMVKGALSSLSQLNVLNDQGALIYGNEIIQYQNSTLEVDGTFTIDTLLRGRRGTEGFCGTHGANELVVDPWSGIKRFADPLSIMNLLRYYRGVTAGHDVSAVPSQQFTIKGVDLKPYAPVHIQGARDGSNNLTLTWIRRTRIGGSWQNLIGTVPLSETSESYDVDILNGLTVVRTITGLTSPTASYTAAQQTTDFGSVQLALSVNVYQKSSSVGRGFPGSARV